MLVTCDVDRLLSYLSQRHATRRGVWTGNSSSGRLELESSVLIVDPLDLNILEDAACSGYWT